MLISSANLPHTHTHTHTHTLYLLDVCIIKVHPSSNLGLEEEGGVMFPVVTHHPHQVQLRLSSLLLRHPVKQLQREQEFSEAAELLSQFLPLYADDAAV